MEVGQFKRIAILIESDNEDIGPKRSLKPAKHFSDLQAQVEKFYPEYICILSIPNTKEIFGWQFEFLLAYQDSLKDTLPLNLKLQANLARFESNFSSGGVHRDQRCAALRGMRWDIWFKIPTQYRI